MTKGSSRKSSNFKVKRSEDIWGLYWDRVFKEIGHMMGVEDTNTNMPGWFQMQMLAIKRVFDSMTTAEKVVLHLEQERMIGKGYPEQTK
jgi:hypothetical protein